MEAPYVMIVEEYYIEVYNDIDQCIETYAVEPNTGERAFIGAEKYD